MFGQENVNKKPNPVSAFFDWKSDKENKTGKFKGRNKELEQEVQVLPEQFILLMQTSCIKGWDDKSQSGIYSNEVVSTKNEELVVKAFKGEELFKGIYDKEAINAIGGNFHKGLIVMEGTTMNEYYLKGGALFQWNEDIANINTNDYKVKFNGCEERKRGAVTYYVPRRVQGDKITEEERTTAMSMVSLLNDYREKDE